MSDSPALPVNQQNADICHILNKRNARHKTVLFSCSEQAECAPQNCLILLLWTSGMGVTKLSYSPALNKRNARHKTVLFSCSEAECLFSIPLVRLAYTRHVTNNIYILMYVVCVIYVYTVCVIYVCTLSVLYMDLHIAACHIKLYDANLNMRNVTNCMCYIYVCTLSVCKLSVLHINAHNRTCNMKLCDAN